MKRVVALAVLLVLGFYVAWPAWSGYRIREALHAQSPEALAAKVDFESVRLSLRPAVTQKVSDGFDRYQTQAGPAGGLILGQLKKDIIPKIVETSLAALLTPETMIRIASEAGPIKESIERIMREQLGRAIPGGSTAPGGASADTGATSMPAQGLGNLFGKVLKGGAINDQPAAATEPAPTPAAPKRTFSLSNVKSFAFNGPLSFKVGVAKDPATADADVTAEMSFTGGDWKVTGLVPRS